MQRIRHPIRAHTGPCGKFAKNDNVFLSERAKNIIRRTIQNGLGQEAPQLTTLNNIGKALKTIEGVHGSWRMWAVVFPGLKNCGKKSLDELKEFAIEHGLAEKFFRLSTPSLLALQKVEVRNGLEFETFVNGTLLWRQRVMAKFSPISKQVVSGISEMEALAGSTKKESGEISIRQWSLVRSAIVESFVPGMADLKWLIENRPGWREELIAQGASVFDVRAMEEFAKKSGIETG